MAATARVSGAAATTVAAATSRIGSGGRNVAPVSPQRVDALGYPHWAGPNDESLHYDEEGGGHFGGGGQQQKHRHEEFVFALNRVANAYKITEYVAANDSTAPRLLMSELIHGVGIYETNMRVIAGNARMLGVHFSLIY